MRMVVQEFETSEVLRSSSGNIIREDEAVEYVAIYEEANTENFNLRHYLNEIRKGNKVDKDVIIIPKKDWESIISMIMRNYTVKPKND